MLGFRYKILFFTLSLFLGLSSCTTINTSKLTSTKQEHKPENFCGEVLTYKGWWVYGEGQHIFKDEDTLEEWDLEFLKEDMGELEELYLAVCEMEYFPMECEMKGTVNEGILYVVSFDILYIQGCGGEE